MGIEVLWCTGCGHVISFINNPSIKSQNIYTTCKTCECKTFEKFKKDERKRKNDEATDENKKDLFGHYF